MRSEQDEESARPEAPPRRSLRSHRPRSPTRGRASLRHRPRSSPTPPALSAERESMISHSGALCQPPNPRTRHTFEEHLWLPLGLFHPPQLREHTPRDARARNPAHVSTTHFTHLAHAWRTAHYTWVTVRTLRLRASLEAAAAATAPFAHPVAAAPSLSEVMRKL
jgi:hypothetical protein